MVHLSKSLTSILASAALCLGAVASAAPMGSTVELQATLSGSSEVPPTSSAGRGTLEARFNKDTKILNYTVTYSGLSGPAKAGHFHGPAAAGANAGVVLPFVGGMDSPIEGTAVLNATQSDELLAGKWYFNLHTAAHPNGEIRGQAQPK